MATINTVGNGLTGSTGTGSFVGSTSPTLVTPILGAASATSLAFTSTSGIIGTTTNDNAAAGSVGEYVESLITTPVSFTDGIVADVGSISLTGGDWNVWGNLFYVLTGNSTIVQAWVSNLSATQPTGIFLSQFNGVWVNLSQTVPAPMIRFSLSGTTTIYLSGVAFFTTGTADVQGFISARRIR